jgi:vacuolar protein sorting-associated protein 13A/C
LQFILGGDLQSCRNALNSRNGSSLHLIERISIDLQVQSSIVPSVTSLARFKISGKLPTLQLNFSDSKYKSVLRLVDVTIPRFDNGDHSAIKSTAVMSSSYQLSSGLFDLPETEYNVEYEDYEDAKDSIDERSREVRGLACISDPMMCHYSEAICQGPAPIQRMFELSFQVTTLRACLHKSQDFAEEKPLGHVSFDNFSLLLLLTQYDMKVEVRLGSVPSRLFGTFHLHKRVAPFPWKSQSQTLNLSNFPLLRVGQKDPLRGRRTFFVWTTCGFRTTLRSICLIMKGAIRSSLWMYLQSYSVRPRSPS